jgi:hypothetical protein
VLPDGVQDFLLRWELRDRDAYADDERTSDSFYVGLCRELVEFRSHSAYAFRCDPGHHPTRRIVIVRGRGAEGGASELRSAVRGTIAIVPWPARAAATEVSPRSIDESKRIDVLSEGDVIVIFVVKCVRVVIEPQDVRPVIFSPDGHGHLVMDGQDLGTSRYAVSQDGKVLWTRFFPSTLQTGLICHPLIVPAAGR